MFNFAVAVISDGFKSTGTSAVGGGIATEEQLGLMIEIDAYAYQKFMLKKLFDIDWHYPNEEYDKVIDSYIKKYLK